MARADGSTYGYEGEPLVEEAVSAATLGTPKTAGKRIRVASYNLEHFEDGIRDGDDRTRDLATAHASSAAAIIERIEPDILVIEELENAEALRMLNDSLKSPFPVAYVTNLGTGQRRREKLNLGVLSSVALDDVKEIDFGPLTGTGRPTRGLLRFSVDLGSGSKLLVYALHLKSNYGTKGRNVAQRQHALRILRDDVDRLAKDQPDTRWEVVLAGDFNVDPELPDFVTDKSLEAVADWADLWKGVPMAQRITIPTRHGNPEQVFPPATFDRFIVSPNLTNEPWTATLPMVLQEGTDTTNVFAKPGTGIHVSDHYPVYVDIVR
jgi:endonuclease/exonuclease/phosphatase family metal-dependent hydrolase